MEAIRRWVDTVDSAVAASAIGHYFRLDGSTHPKARSGARFLTEIRGGITIFFTMAYIISVNATIITQSGGTCDCDRTNDPTCDKSDEYAACLVVLNRDIITATAAMSALSSFAMGLLANLPIALAPGMGINAYFTYQVVGYHGTGPVTYRMAVTAVFIEGLIFVALSLLGMRQWLARVIPNSIKIACGAGIGLYLCFIGLTNSAGIGIINGAMATPVELGGCLPEYRDEFGACTSHKLGNPTVWIGFLLGCLLTALLMMYKIKSAMIIGILIVSIFSWPRGTNFTYFPDTVTGNTQFDFFKKVVTFHPIQTTLAVQEWNLAGAGGQFALALFTFLYVDILDVTGTLYSMVRFCGVVDPETGDFERQTVAYTTDATMISIGALFGTSPVTAFIESGAGIAQGAKTGIAAMTAGVCFFIAIFFAPIFASIPPWATGGALMLVGCMMMKAVMGINWNYPGDAIPAFATLVFMPFSYSIAYGLIAGLMSYTILNGTAWFLKLITGGRIAPADEDLKEYWTYKLPENAATPWFVRALRGEKRFWADPNKDQIMELHSVASGKGERDITRRESESP
ncbi:Efflux pump notK [Drechslerella dactyloides]|uniref:Efflux pump notK n=1 Tax=Drechslerella dactyloides TaxID=74499 RepID=A0AAD6J5C7_DREDA|nr:Efflux pump notK [Drechslerella dactyloides]